MSESSNHLSQTFAGKRVLITGGAGFLGSNLAIALVELGAHVTIADAMIPGYGGNLFNLAPVRGQVVLNFSDIRDVNAMNYLVKDQDFIFHLAGQVDHILSLTDPFPDIDMNIKGTAVLMEACKHHNRAAKVIHTGTRGQYGPAVSLPVGETAPTYPKGIYEISRLTAEKIIQVYHEVHGVQAVLLRLTNIYGERAQMQHARYGVVNWFVRLAIDDATIQVFGDGLIKRDFLHVADCVTAMLSAAACEAAYGQIFNVGVDHPTNFIELTEAIIAVAGTGRWAFAPFSAERKAQEPGDFYSDIGKIKQIVGWQPQISLTDGLARTIAYYRQHKGQYW
jgi:UDP-glucose 4-epimerase